MKSLLLGIVLSGVVTQAHAGAGASGGGNAVFIDGSVRFLDLVSKEKLYRASRDESDLKKVFTGARYTKRFGVDYKSQFSKTLNKVLTPWDHVQTGWISVLREATQYANVTIVNLNLYELMNRGRLHDYFGMSPSPSASPEVQIPVAFYDRMSIYLINDVWEKLPALDQDAVVVHESLRLFAHRMASVGYNLDTEAIESITRILIEGPSSSNQNELEGLSPILATRTANTERNSLKAMASRLSETPDSWIGDFENTISALEKIPPVARDFEGVDELYAELQLNINGALKARPELRDRILNAYTRCYAIYWATLSAKFGKSTPIIDRIAEDMSPGFIPMEYITAKLPFGKCIDTYEGKLVACLK